MKVQVLDLLLVFIEEPMQLIMQEVYNFAGTNVADPCLRLCPFRVFLVSTLSSGGRKSTDFRVQLSRASMIHLCDRAVSCVNQFQGQ